MPVGVALGLILMTPVGAALEDDKDAFCMAWARPFVDMVGAAVGVFAVADNIAMLLDASANEGFSTANA